MTRFVAFLALLLAALPGCGRRSTPASVASDGAAAAVVRAAAHPVTGADTDYDPLMTLIGDARVVFLGESTHGTHEYYRERARITRRLVEEKGFTAVAIEGDWPETFRVNEYVRGRGSDVDPIAALSGYETRFPTWMWGNADVRDLVEWMRARNASKPAAGEVGIYGLDVYSLGTSIAAVGAYLAGVDPAAAERVRTLYQCFTPTGGDPQRYGASLSGRGGATCQAAARAVLDTMTRRAATPPSDPDARDALFSALRNAHAVVNAEEYYRTAYLGGANTWNLRDQRMAEGLEAIEGHLAAMTGRPARTVVWAHNTHAGDARHTESGEQGEHNIGQLVRQRLGAAAVSVGFFTHRGTVFAADEWDQPGRVKTLRPALRDSYSDVFHQAALEGPRDFLLVLRGAGAVADTLATERLERAVGVIYLPQSERQSHYFMARLSRQFDAVVFVDSSSAVRPLR
jgi:erythromycin esterase-like protein